MLFFCDYFSTFTWLRNVKYLFTWNAKLCQGNAKRSIKELMEIRRKKRSFDSPIIQTFRLFLYLCVYINLPRFQKHVQNFQVSQFGCVVEASITVLLLKTNTD